MTDETAEAVLRRIAEGRTSDIELSDSDEDTVVDPNFSANLDDTSSESDYSEDDGPSSSSSGRGDKSWKRHQG